MVTSKCLAKKSDRSQLSIPEKMKAMTTAEAGGDGKEEPVE